MHSAGPKQSGEPSAQHVVCVVCSGRPTPFHEDSQYWWQDGAGRVTKEGLEHIVTLWVAIDHTHRDNGCMKVIPGSHTNGSAGFSEYEDFGQNGTFSRQITNIDDSDAVLFELKPNECSLHDGRLIHGAEANMSNERRCGLTMRYFSLDCNFCTQLGRETSASGKHKLFWAAGENNGLNVIWHPDDNSGPMPISPTKTAKL